MLHVLKEVPRMTFRIYVRWPANQVSQKTTTEVRAVADFAFDELRSRSSELLAEGALGVTYTSDSKQVNFIDLVAMRAAGSRS